VTFYLDGHKLATVTKAHDHYFSITINTTGLSFGMHHLVAKVNDDQHELPGNHERGIVRSRSSPVFVSAF
jgi:hypothetical protein